MAMAAIKTSSHGTVKPLPRDPDNQKHFRESVAQTPSLKNFAILS
jgi:hypothetical protein